MFQCSIGFSIAERLAKEGAKVVISSRNKDKVSKALDALKSQNFDCHGITCHVAKKSDRTNLINEVNLAIVYLILIC